MRSAPDRTRPPVTGPPPAIRLPPLARGTLANGIEWIHAELRDLPLVDVQIVVRCGVERDPPDRPGLATLTAETLEEGTQTRTGFEIADGIDRLGARLIVRAAWDESGVSLHALATRVDEALDIAAELLVAPAFPEAEVRRRRGERIAALLQERDEPAALAARALATAIYGDSHPYGRPPTGTVAAVESLDRDLLAAFHAAGYGPGVTFIVTAGDATPDAIERLLETRFGAWTGSAAPAGMPAGPAATHSPGIHLVERPGAAQSEIRVGAPGPPRATPDYFALVVLNTILGGAFTSRLNLKLREEKGFTYGARSGFAFRRGGGPFVAGAAVATEATAEAIDDTLHEIHRLREEPVPVAELDRARRYLALGLPRRLETASAMALQLAELHLHDMDPAELAEYQDRIAAVTAADVLAAARRWLDPEDMAITVVGDAGRLRTPLTDLGRGPVLDHEVRI